MKPMTHLISWLTTLCTITVLSCGGGSLSTTLTAGGGVGGTGVTSSGEVTAFGSVWVNGTRFDTQTAEVYIDGVLKGVGDQVVLDQLDIGRIVQVDAALDASGNAVASKISHTPILLGAIESITPVDLYDTRITILGQSVIVNDQSTLKNVTLGSLQVGNYIEVSGFFDGSGNVQAIFLSKLADNTAPTDDMRVSGRVTGLDTVMAQFGIGTLTIDYRMADTSPLAPAGIANDMLVSVSGNLAGGATFSAAVIRLYLRLGDAESGLIELEGFVTVDPVSGAMSLDGYAFATSPETTFIGGFADDLVDGVRIELEGELNQGAIAADKITYYQSFRAESDLAAFDPVSGTLELSALGALAIETNALTRFSGLIAQFDDLTVGDHLVIKGWLTGDQSVLARQVVALPAVQDKVVLRGTVLAGGTPLVTVNGVQIDTDTIADDGFFDAAETPISRQDFIDAALPDAWVQAKGTLLPGNTVDWTSIGFFLGD